MAVSRERRLAPRRCPASPIVRRALRDYLMHSGLSAPAFANLINYSKESVNAFLADNYTWRASTDKHIAEAMWEFIHQHPVSPAKLHTGRPFRTKDAERIRQSCLSALQGRRWLLVEGGPGTQKSYALYHFFCERNRRERDAAYVYAAAEMTPSALLRQIAETLGAYTHGTRDRLMRNVLYAIAVRQRLPVVIVDEAQHLVSPYTSSLAAVETLREVGDRTGCGVVLGGSHEFDRALRDGSGRYLQQWHRRLTLERLNGLTPEEIEHIVKEELGDGFNPKGLPALVGKCLEKNYGRPYYSCGRLLEILCEFKAKLAVPEGKAL